jgi:hypothetical protein
MKKCNTCQEIKNLCEFSKHKGKKDGYSSSCLICIRKKNKIYRENNKDKENTRVSRFLNKNIDYRKNYMKKYSKLKRNDDPLFKLKHNIRVRILKFIKSKNIKKNNKTTEIIGCNFLFLKEYLESKFTEGMSWDKLGKEIHIDHIIPLSSAKTNEEILILCHYTNLQPLWLEDNLKKGNKILN